MNSLNQAENSGKIHGIKIASTAPAVHHLLFADDSLLLCHASAAEATEILNCLKFYGEASGQVINQQKFSIIFGNKVDSNQKRAVKSFLRIDKEGDEGSYLGLPESFSGSKRKLLQFIQEKL